LNDLLVDGPSLWARCFYAANPRKDEAIDLKKSLDISARMVLRLVRELHVDRTLFCWDTSAKKDKQRSVKPDEYYDGIAQLQDLLVKIIDTVNYYPEVGEADDCVATAVYRDSENKLIVVSSDKDLQQLVSANTSYYSLYEGALLSRRFILNKWGVKRPIQIAIALAIIGDPGDQVPGVPGFGKKKVHDLFIGIDPEAPFSDVLKVIEAHIPEKHREVFYESLELTLLCPDAKNLPWPKAVKFDDSFELADGFEY